MYTLRSWEHFLNEASTICSSSLSSPLFNIDEARSDDDRQECSSPNTTTDSCDAQGSVYADLTLRHIEPGGIGINLGGLGYSTGYTTLEGLVFPLSQLCNKQSFIDLRAHWFNNNEWAGNIGVGSRFLNSCRTIAYGLNFYFDFRTTRHRKFFFPQFGTGFEVLSNCWDFRVNGYFPFERKHRVSRNRLDYTGGYFIQRNKYNVSLAGFDAELGRHLFQCNCFQFYVAVGPYYYQKNGRVNSFLGGRARAQLSYTQYMSIEGIFTYDRRYKAIFQGSFAVTIPLGRCRSKERYQKTELRNSPQSPNSLLQEPVRLSRKTTSPMNHNELAMNPNRESKQRIWARQEFSPFPQRFAAAPTVETNPSFSTPGDAGFIQEPPSQSEYGDQLDQQVQDILTQRIRRYEIIVIDEYCSWRFNF